MDEIRLIACDVDGTLLQQGETELRPQLFDLIRRLAAQGVEFCVASGRAYSSVRELFGPVAGQISFVCENGGVVYRDGLLLEALDKREHGPLTACVADLVEAGRNSCLDVVSHIRQLQQ